MSSKILGHNLCCFLIVALFAASECQNWRGNIENYRRWEPEICSRCICWYIWGCAYYRNFQCNRRVSGYRCQRGWRHNGDYNCNQPICGSGCGIGICTAPDTCDCQGEASGPFCQTLTCSHARPCYPGNCYNNDKCRCLDGFTKSSDYGCMEMAAGNKPSIGRSTLIIQHIRNTDNRVLYYFLLDGTNETKSNLVVWSNQRVFNKMDFEFEMKYEGPAPLPERPGYVHSTEVGITKGHVELRLIDFKGVEHPVQKYDKTCVGSNRDNPIEVFNCTIRKEEFKTLVEHADTLKVTFIAENGGYRIINDQGNIQPREYFDGQMSRKNVFFKFDFQAPKHCSEDGVDGYTLSSCGSNAKLLHVRSQFTKKPVTVSWKDWTDDRYGSQMWMYYLELHKLVVKDATKHLTERNPISPMDTAQVLHMGNVLHSHTFKPKEPGIYSILLEVRDIANNSRIARRFVVYDKKSDVEVNTDSPTGLHISTAESHTGYRWQTNGKEGQDTPITVNWTDYFMNKAHEEGYYNNEIDRFPVQFQNLEDDGILFAKKFVDPRLDDNDGERTLDPIPSVLGIVQFEYQYTHDVNLPSPAGRWRSVAPIQQTITITEKMNTGDQIKFWVRARDVLGNEKIDSTMVTTDFTPPAVSSIGDKTRTFKVLNDRHGPFNYSSRFHLEAFDTESGVTELGIEINITVPDGPDKTVTKTAKANTDATRHPDRDSECVQSRDKSTCFLRDQTVYIDNCWLTVPNQAHLSTASASVIVRVYNQVMLTNSVTYEIPSISDLSGLETYTGPTSARIENVQTGSFRIAWEFPERLSCYTIQTSIVILLFKKQTTFEGVVTKTGMTPAEPVSFFATMFTKLSIMNVTKPGANGTLSSDQYIVSGSKTYFDIASLDPDTDYHLSFTPHVGGKANVPLQLSVKTTALPRTGVPVAVIVGIAVGVLAFVAIVIVFFVVLVRRGYIHPQERARRVKRAMSKKYRDSLSGDAGTGVGRRGQKLSNAAYDPNQGLSNRRPMSEQEELYLYGGMDINMPDVRHLDRDDITFEGIIKDGHFARIYKATMRSGKSNTTVVAKTLKERFSTADEMLMRAKINFTGTVVGDHPNVLKCIGSVVGDDEMGPFIIYEYCEKGTLKDYLLSQKDNVTIEVQEHLFRFGLDIAKGMEYLASRNIVHRRLAARNILLTFLSEVKITGFGPQPDAEDDDGDSGKQERIPIKWMAPECMSSTKDATEKSDVWSYAVVLWEIFTFGDTPYSKMKSRQLPMALKKGERLHKSEQCDDTWYEVMKRCWAYVPHKRPTFTEVRSELDGMFVASPGDDYYYYKR